MTQRETVVDFDFHGEALDNIFDDYEVMVNKCPVGHSSKYGGFTYLAKSEDIFAAEQDPETFAVQPSMLLPAFGTDDPLIPIDIDPPAHSGYRSILLPMFTPMNIKKLEPWMHDVGKQLAADVIEAGKDGAPVNLSALVARAMPTIIFSRLAGYPEEDWPKFDRWIDEIIYDRVEKPEVAWAAGDELNEYFKNLVEERRANGEEKDDIIGKVLTATVDGRALTDDEILSYLFLLFLAGLDTTAWAIRASIWYLGHNLKAQQQLREDPKKIPAAVEEFLRTLSPVQVMARTCMRDTVVSGTEIKQGERVALVFGAGNRDPEVFENPNEIILDREDNRHLAFGAGIHRCLGSNLARAEIVIALEELLAAVPEFTCSDSNEPWHGVGPLHATIKIGA